MKPINKMKEITIKIKPKLKWEIDPEAWEKTYYANDFEIVWNKEKKKWDLLCSRYIATFRTIKTAKAVAELIYRG